MVILTISLERFPHIVSSPSTVTDDEADVTFELHGNRKIKCARAWDDATSRVNQYASRLHSASKRCSTTRDSLVHRRGNAEVQLRAESESSKPGDRNGIHWLDRPTLAMAHPICSTTTTAERCLAVMIRQLLQKVVLVRPSTTICNMRPAD
jgi:hypothetical protein